MSDKKFTVHVARESGHEQELMTRENIVEMVSANENTWVFVDSQMVSVEELENIELNDSTEIRINPGMVGGAETFTVLVASEAGDQAMTMTKQELTTVLTNTEATGSLLMAKWSMQPPLQTPNSTKTTSCDWCRPLLADLKRSRFRLQTRQAIRSVK